MKRMKKQACVDILLLAAAVLVLITGCILDFRLIERPGRGIIKAVHTYGGYIMAVLVVLHLAQYFKVFLNKMRMLSK